MEIGSVIVLALLGIYIWYVKDQDTKKEQRKEKIFRQALSLEVAEMHSGVRKELIQQLGSEAGLSKEFEAALGSARIKYFTASLVPNMVGHPEMNVKPTIRGVVQEALEEHLGQFKLPPDEWRKSRVKGAGTRREWRT